MAVNVTILRSNSIYDDAAFVLGRYGPVYRCDENGKPNDKGTHWRIGPATVLTNDELLARAERYRRKAA